MSYDDYISQHGRKFGISRSSPTTIILDGKDGLQLHTCTVATVPAAATHTGCIIYVSDGAAGSPILAFSDGANWLRSDTGAAVAAA